VKTRPAEAGRAKFDIGEIVRGHQEQLKAKHPLTREQKRALTDFGQCRTAALGGHIDQCPSCGYESQSYNSCRNRHCPKCQALAQERWIAQRKERLLDARHFHVVLTLPSELRFLAKLAPQAVFDVLFDAAKRTLLELGERRLRAILGATLVLHTWTRALVFHPHIHAIVTAGGLALDGKSFLRMSGKYLFPVKAMGALFRGKVLAGLSKAYKAGAFAHVNHFADPMAFGALVTKVNKLSWNVYAKSPLKDSSHVVAYLGRYTHRVGIANSRLLDVTDKKVVFRTRGDQTKTLDPVEFLARLVQHVLPDGFHKIRHVGLYGSPKLDAARALLGQSPIARHKRRSAAELLCDLVGHDIRLCPMCLTPMTQLPIPKDLARERAPPVEVVA
jgi:hypothetical protein